MIYRRSFDRDRQTWFEKIDRKMIAIAKFGDLDLALFRSTYRWWKKRQFQNKNFVDWIESFSYFLSPKITNNNSFPFLRSVPSQKDCDHLTISSINKTDSTIWTLKVLLYSIQPESSSIWQTFVPFFMTIMHDNDASFSRIFLWIRARLPFSKETKNAQKSAHACNE